jgi:hypothetical protein
MTRRLWITGLFLAAGLCLAVGLAGAADKKEASKGDDAAKNEQAVANIAIAYKLADLGRKADSPEALIAAAKILNNIHEVQDIKNVEPATSDPSMPPKPGEPIPEKPDKANSADFSADVKKLLEEAKDMTKDEKVLAVIDSVKITPTRGAIGGPRRIVKLLKGGANHVYTIRYAGGVQARAVVSCPVNVSLQVYGPGGSLIGQFNGKSEEIYWNPKNDNDFTIRVVNLTGTGAEYTLTTN